MLLERYGGAEANAMAARLRDTVVLESEKYIEYDESGAVKGAPKAIAKSKYAENVLINNHTSVWGSWWSNFQWGYACCHSIVKNSYCTGDEGKKAFEEADRMRTGGAFSAEEDQPTKVIEWAVTDHDGAANEPPAQLPKKRTLEQMAGGVTEEDMDEWKRKRTTANDPMAAFVGKDELA